VLSNTEKEDFQVYDLGAMALGANPDAMGIDRFKAGFAGRNSHRAQLFGYSNLVDVSD
jgi:hypothetical protein